MKELEENYISAVVVIHNDAQLLAEKLKSLHSTLVGIFKYFEIIVVDNFSQDNTGEVLKTLKIPLSIITLARWHNAQSALTAGVELAIGDYILELPTINTDAHYNSIEKLYRLAKFINIESKNSMGKGIPCRPAACYTDIDECFELLDKLKKLDIIDFTDISDPPIYQKPRRMIMNIKMLFEARMAFEEGVNSPEEFKKAFMSKNDGVKVTVTGEKSQVNVVSGEGSITATQNNASNIAELQTLLDRLLQAVPPDTPKETTEQIRESIETIQAETRSPTPKKNLIKTIFTGLGGIVRTAEFAVALAELAQFFGV
jgi:hypothetical protein